MTGIVSVRMSGGNLAMGQHRQHRFCQFVGHTAGKKVQIKRARHSQNQVVQAMPNRCNQHVLANGILNKKKSQMISLRVSALYDNEGGTVVEVPSAEAPFPLKCSLDTDGSTSPSSFQRLNDLLASGEWEEADNETRAMLIKIAGEGAIKRKWVYFTEARAISVDDLQTIDKLWKHYSSDRYGYSVQKQIWIQSGKRWAKFFKKLDWVQGENDAYRKWPEEFFWKKDAKQGHLPLTNCLRGTQLLQALLEHEAFE